MKTATAVRPVHDSDYVLVQEDQETGRQYVYTRTRPFGPWRLLSSESPSMAWQWAFDQMLAVVVKQERGA